MKRTILLAGLALALTTPATANAANITTTYCNSSLRGKTGQAPDNDIAAYWAKLENLGYDVVSSMWVEYYYYSPQNLELTYKFELYSGGVKYRAFRCWRSSDGVYHDGLS